jgi:hypothetical protein
MKEGTMRKLLFVAAVGSAALGVTAVAIVHGFESGTQATRAQAVVQPPLSREVGAPEHGGALPSAVRERLGTRRELGRVTLRNGEVVRIRSFETVDGMSCLEDVRGDSGPGSSCVHGSLLGGRSAFYSISSDGGPARFSSMVVVGLVSPRVGSVALEKTDGSVTSGTLSRDRAFAIELAPAELAADVLPAALLLFGKNGQLVERQVIPSPR